MTDPKFNTLPVDAEGDFVDYETTLTPEQAAEHTRQARRGLSINDTIAGNASMSVGGRGADTSGVEAGAGAGAGTTHLSAESSATGSPAPTIVPEARAAGTTMRGEPGYDQAPTNLPTTEEISALAYDYWVARDYAEGSHEEDWRRAEEELFRRRQLTMSAEA